MNKNNKMALCISVVYCVASTLWIHVTDRLLPIFAETSTDIATLATYKGMFFIATTALFLYLTIRYFAKGRCNRCHSVLETINDAVLIYDLDTGTVLDVNKKAREIFGRSPGEFQPGFSTEEMHASHDGWKEPREWFAKAADTGLETFEWQTRQADGSLVWLDVRLQRIVVNGTLRLIAVARDISERKRSEQSLKRFNRTLRMLLTCNEVLTRAQSETELFENVCRIIVEDGFYRHAWVGLAGNDAEKSVRPAAYAGLPPGSSTMAGITWKDTDRGRGPTGSAIREGLPCLVRDAQNDRRFFPWREEACSCGYLSVLSVPLMHANTVFGALTVCASEADAFDDEEMSLMIQLAGDMAYGISSLKSAAERKHMEGALVKSEKNLADAQSIASLGSWEYDLETDEEYRSDEFFRILGLSPQESGRASDSVFDYIHPDDRDQVLRKITETLEEGKPYDVEYRIIRADGSEGILHAQGKTQQDSTGKTTKFIGTAFDITERKKADMALRESELRFRTLVETSTDWIWEVDENAVYVYASPKIRDLLGYEPEEIIGRTPFDLMHPQDAQRLAHIFTEFSLQRKPFRSLENINIHKNGGLVTIETSGVPFFDENGRFCGYRGIDRDVTDRKKLEEKYLQAQKMEAIGQLAGGIAHDFNNILTAIIGFQHLLLDTVEGEKPRHFAKQVLSLADKASHLTRDLLAFSRKQTIHPKHMDLNDTIRKIVKILKRLIGEDIELQLTLHDHALPVMAVTGQMEQVFMNLATNARDAMPEGGLLTITTEVVTIDNSFVHLHRHGEAGRYALISFSDTGTGMDEATRLRVFEPFFTTKEVGKGTGLGLSTAYGIIHQHEGFITVYSEPGEGTSFRIYLPLFEAEIAQQDTDLRSDRLPPRGRETVLLVEDEPEVRQVMGTLLEKNGYKVIIAVDGEHAIERYIEYEDNIDLLILDVIMPKKNGKEVYDIISRARNDVRTIFISGYTADIVEQKGIPETCHLVSKPFSPHAFLWKVRDVLDEGPAENADAGR
ncbi:MAG: PAS domain S-box protein [Deltaproteobacteria bacterium]|nr:PAS domain S-box protein [Deltaproteobacteria bacterium]